MLDDLVILTYSSFLCLFDKEVSIWGSYLTLLQSSQEVRPTPVSYPARCIPLNSFPEFNLIDDNR